MEAGSVALPRSLASEAFICWNYQFVAKYCDDLPGIQKLQSSPSANTFPALLWPSVKCRADNWSRDVVESEQGRGSNLLKCYDYGLRWVFLRLNKFWDLRTCTIGYMPCRLVVTKTNARRTKLVQSVINSEWRARSLGDY